MIGTSNTKGTLEDEINGSIAAAWRLFNVKKVIIAKTQKNKLTSMEKMMPKKDGRKNKKRK